MGVDGVGGNEQMDGVGGCKQVITVPEWEQAITVCDPRRNSHNHKAASLNIIIEKNDPKHSSQ